MAPVIKIRGAADAYTKDDVLGKKRLGPPSMVQKKIGAYLFQSHPTDIYPLILIFVELMYSTSPAFITRPRHSPQNNAHTLSYVPIFDKRVRFFFFFLVI